MLFLSGSGEELLIVGFCLLCIVEQIGAGIGDVVIGGDGVGIIGEVLFPRSNGLGIMLRQVVAFTLREGDGAHDGGIGLDEVASESEVAETLLVALGIDTDHTEAVGTAIVLHATDEEGQLQIFVGALQVFYL